MLATGVHWTRWLLRLHRRDSMTARQRPPLLALPTKAFRFDQATGPSNGPSTKAASHEFVVSISNADRCCSRRFT